MSRRTISSATCVRPACKTKMSCRRTAYTRVSHCVRDNKEHAGIIISFASSLGTFAHLIFFPTPRRSRAIRPISTGILEPGGQPPLPRPFFPFTTSGIALLPFIAPAPLTRGAALRHCRHANCVIAHFNNARKTQNSVGEHSKQIAIAGVTRYKRVDEIPVRCI